MKKTLLTVVIAFVAFQLLGQNEVAEKQNHFYGDLFINANYNSNNSQASFRVNRLHLGYKHIFSEKLYFNGMLESAREDYSPTSDYNQITNLFELCLGFQTEKFEGKFGLIGTEFNQQQEKLWKHRYVDKVFADKYGYAPTNDFGFLIKYKPNRLFNADFAITNGEGHKNYQADSSFRYALGISLKPIKNIVFRMYSDAVIGSEFGQTNIIGILGYESEYVTLGIEYNKQLNSNNLKNIERNGFSSYLTFNINESYQLFGRYDLIESTTSSKVASEWELSNNGELYIIGVQYNIHEDIILALDYRAWDSKKIEETKSYIFVELAFSF